MHRGIRPSNFGKRLSDFGENTKDRLTTRNTMPKCLNIVLQVIGHFEQQDSHSFRQRARSELGLLGSTR